MSYQVGPTKVRYLAYGSNMFSERLRQRVPSATLLGVTELRGWALRFHKRSVDESGKCSIVLSNKPKAVLYGVVFLLEADERPLLDAVEGVGSGYRCEGLRVEVHGEAVSAFAYVAESTHIDESLRPYGWYRDLVIAGAREHGLPDWYVRWLLEQPFVDDPDRPRAAINEALLGIALRRGQRVADPGTAKRAGTRE